MDTSNKVCATHWAHPLALGGGSSVLPEPDLNNLFKYAVPVAVKVLRDKYNYAESYAIDTIMTSWRLESDGIPDAYGLQRAIWEVIHRS